MQRLLSSVLAVSLLLSASALGQEKMEMKGEDEFVKNMLAQFNGLGEKFIALAKATPAEKLDWRPAEGVRSIREVLTHAADANLFFITMAGLKNLEGPALSRDRKERENRFKTNADIEAALKASFDHVKAQVSGMTHEQVHAEAKMFGQTTTNMNVLIVSAGHLHEHLGQAIAYARSNGVTPPWNAQ